MIDVHPLTVAVLGATGVLGRAVVPRLLARGHTVRAQARDPGRAAALAAMDATVVAGDILDPASLAPIVARADAVLHLATAVPKPGAPMDWRANDRIRREGTANLIDACRTAGVARYVQQSIAMVHMPGGDALLDEDAPTQPSANTASAIDMEALVEASGLDWCILRGGAFYGPGTGRDEAWLSAARTGELVLPGDGSGYISLIHVADMAQATVAATEAADGPSTYLVVDDRPVTYAEMYGTIAAALGAAPPPPGGPPGLASFRCSNARARRALGWASAYPDYRAGLAPLL